MQVTLVFPPCQGCFLYACLGMQQTAVLSLHVQSRVTQSMHGLMYAQRCDMHKSGHTCWWGWLCSCMSGRARKSLHRLLMVADSKERSVRLLRRDVGRRMGSACYVCGLQSIVAASMQICQAAHWIQTAVSYSVGWQCREAA